MRIIRLVNFLYLSHFSHPLGERSIYRLIRRHRPTAILEIGIGSGIRSLRMAKLAAQYAAGNVHFVGLDRFESRPPDHPPGISLKQAHCLMKARGSRVQLVPGDPYSALRRVANSLRDMQLVIIAGEEAGQAMADAWFYLPRTLHAQAIVLVESIDSESGERKFRPLDRQQIEQLAAPGQRRAA